MKRQPKLSEQTRARVYRGPHQEIAVYVRDLLNCDCALVAVLEKDSIRVQGFASREGEAIEKVSIDVIAQLRDWGPIVVDEARLIAVPVYDGGLILGLLIGYSSTPGTFTADDLQKLTTFTPVAAGILTDTATAAKDKTSFTVEELSHASRLITIGELASCLAHEVTNPLTLIRGHLRFIDEALSADDPLRVNMEVIDRASRRIEELTQRTLDFSKKKTRWVSRGDITEVIREALRFLEPHLRTNFVDVRVQIQADLPNISIDRCRMLQAIVNVLQNAVDAMADVSERVLSIKAGVDGKRMRIVVSDTGTGIATGDLAKIFHPFFTTKGERGTGLGLFITRQVIDEHRGAIDIQAASPGTSFIISLPL